MRPRHPSGPIDVGEHEIVLGREVRCYRLRRSARRTLAITVEPGGGLVVTAPDAATLAQIEAVLRRRRQWIARRTREAAALPPPSVPREWVSGETHRYLGRQYRLRVRRGASTTTVLTGRYIAVTVPNPADREQVRRAAEQWYRTHARETFSHRMQNLVRQTSRLRLKAPPELIVRQMRKRWGSCSAGGRILMNVDAVKLPVGCIDYLILHELCHVRVPNHGSAFWRLLDACMPDWERWRRRLDHVET